MGMREALGYMGYTWGMVLGFILVAFVGYRMVKRDSDAIEALGFAMFAGLMFTFLGGFEMLGVSREAFGR